MLLLFIENQELLSKMAFYLDEANISYTTDLHANYDGIVIAEMTSRIINLLDSNKQIYFLTDLEEENIVQYESSKSKKARTYWNRLTQILNRCNRVITRMPSIQLLLEKKVKTEIVVQPYELPIINISKSNKDIFEKYHLPKRKKRILLFDFHYQHLNYIYDLAIHNPKDHFLIIGYVPDYLLSIRNKKYIHQMPKNVSLIKYMDFNIYSDLCKVCHMVILYATLLQHEYLDITLLFKKPLLYFDCFYFMNYLRNGKTAYSFKNKEELLSYYQKLRDEKLPNVTDYGYQLVQNHTKSEILKNYNRYLC